MEGANIPRSVRPDQQILDTLVQQVVETAHPLRIILFGSAAEERIGQDSDLDVLVIVRDGAHRRHTAQAIYKSLSGLGIPKDIIVVTESDVRKHKDNPSLVIFPALERGKELYNAIR